MGGIVRSIDEMRAIAAGSAKAESTLKASSSSESSFEEVLKKAMESVGDPISPKSSPSAAPARPQGKFMEQALGVWVYRQQLIASNIANADTPGYKAVDIDVEEAMEKIRASAQPLSLQTSSPLHLQGSAIPTYTIMYHVPDQVSADGNTVEVDVERTKFAQTALMHRFALDRVSDEFKDMAELFRALK